MLLFAWGMSVPFKVGCLGAGRMATALARGLIQQGVVPAAQIMASDPSTDARQAFAQETGARAVGDNLEVGRFADLWIVAVKPYQVSPLLKEIESHESFQHWFSSPVFSLRRLYDT